MTEHKTSETVTYLRTDLKCIFIVAFVS